MLAKNESTVDRVIRGVLGAGLLVASFAGLGVTLAKPLVIVAALIGAILLLPAPPARAFCTGCSASTRPRNATGSTFI